jgi:Ca-activated chloride channel homolog
MTKRNRTLALLLATLMAAGALGGCAGKAKTDAPQPTGAPSPAPSESRAPSMADSGTSRPVSPPSSQAPTGSPATKPAPAQEAAPAGMYHQDYGTNPNISPKTQPTSTFGVDIDTASYTLARSYILDSRQLPPPEAVRVEEFINYFPQQYKAPNEGVALYVDGGPSPFRPGMHLVQIGLKAEEVSQRERKPAMLTFVIDISGSMNMDNRLGLVKRSLNVLIDQLSSDDQVGIVVYGSQGRVELQPTADKERIRQTVNRLSTEGSTNAADGLKLAYGMASRFYLAGGVNRVILCSDGVANTGLTDPDGILRTIEDEKSRGITLTTVGFGMGNYNDVLMEQLADKGDGQYAYVDDLAEARRMFEEQLLGTLELIAKDAKVQVTFDADEVLSYRLVGYENRWLDNRDFRNDAVDGGEMGSGHTVTALYEVTLTGRDSQLGQVSIRYKDPDTGEVIEQAAPIMRSTVTGRAPARVRWTASVAEFAGLLRQSPWAMESRLDTIREVAWDAARDLGMTQSHADAIDLMDRAIQLRGRR